MAVKRPEGGIDVRHLIGAPYKWGGRGPEIYDCWGICIEIYKMGGVILPDEDCDGSDESRKVCTAIHESSFVEVDYSQYCLAKFAIGPNWHGGVMINETDCIQSREKTGCAVIRINEFPWKTAFQGFYGYNG